MNNEFQTMEEMADIAERIFTGQPLKEDIVEELRDFLNNYKNMKDVLASLQNYLQSRVREQKKTKLMGDGSILKAINASKKVDGQLQKMNKEARDFILIMKQVLENDRG